MESLPTSTVGAMAAGGEAPRQIDVEEDEGAGLHGGAVLDDDQDHVPLELHGELQQCDIVRPGTVRPEIETDRCKWPASLQKSVGVDRPAEMPVEHMSCITPTEVLRWRKPRREESDR